MSVSYLAEIETHVAGIPCIVGVVDYHRERGSYSYNAASDLDYYGYTEAAWEVLDRRGRKAEWLARKLTNDDVSRIEEKIAKRLK